MAYMKYCNRNGCNRLIPQGVAYCKEHTVTQTEKNRERHKEYDAHCRDQKSKAFYNGAEWKTARAAVLSRDCGIDIYLYIMEGAIVPADMVHHIIELKEDYSKRCDIDNLISVSERTHKTVIDEAYKDDIKRSQMQQTLRECMERYRQQVDGEGV